MTTDTQAELRDAIRPILDMIIWTCDNGSRSEEADEAAIHTAINQLLKLLPPAPAVVELTDEMLCAGSDRMCLELGLPQVDHRGTILNVWKVMQDEALAALGEGASNAR